MAFDLKYEALYDLSSKMEITFQFSIVNDAFVMTIHATQESLVRKVILHHTSDVDSVLKDIEGMEFNVGLYHVSKTLRRATRLIYSMINFL